MDEMRQALDAGLPELGLDLPETGRETLCRFGNAVIEQNKVMNLTAITEPAQVARLHLLDSLTVLLCENLSGKTVIDVGCGAGFPGMPLQILCPSCRLTLLDSLGKRIKFLQSCIDGMGLQQIEAVHARAEEYARAVPQTEVLVLAQTVTRARKMLGSNVAFASALEMILLKVAEEYTQWRW